MLTRTAWQFLIWLIMTLCCMAPLTRLKAQNPPPKEQAPRKGGDSTLKKTDSIPNPPKIAILKEVMVKSAGPAIERKIDRTVVNIDNNITYAGSNALELMQRLPGVLVSPDGGITLNGRSGVNVLLDGKPVYLSMEDLRNLLSGMLSSVIQKIEIMTNPSARFDASGTGGIINIVRKKKGKEGLNGSLDGSFGQGYYPRYTGNFALSFRNEKYNLYLGNGYSYRAEFFNKTVASHILDANHALYKLEVSDNDNVSTSRAFAPSLSMDLYLTKRTTLSFSGDLSTGISDDRTLAGMDILDGQQNLVNREDFTGIHKDKPFHFDAAMRLVHQVDTLGKEFSIDLDYAGFWNKPGQNNLTITHDTTGKVTDQTTVFLDQARRLHIYAAKADYVQPMKNKGRFEAGLKSSYVEAYNDNTFYALQGGQYIPDPLQSNYSFNSENINAAYLNFNIPRERLTVQAGLRAEQTVTRGKQIVTGESLHQNYLQLFPTLFLDYKAGKEHGLILRLGRRTERASYSEMVPFRRPQTPTLYFQGNPNLRPQTSWHGEVVYSFHNVLFLTLGYDLYRDYIRTLPYLDSNQTTITRVPTNIQHARSWNADIAFTKKMTNWWSTDNTISFYRNVFSGYAGAFSLDNPGIVSVYSYSNNSITLAEGLSAEADFEYNSRRQLVTSSFGPYSVLNLGLRKTILKKSGSVSLTVKNLLNMESHDAIDHYQGLDQYSYWNFYTRVVLLNFSYRFGKSVKKSKIGGGAEERERAGN